MLQSEHVVFTYLEMCHYSGVDERVHRYSLTYGLSIMICFYMMGLGANFTMREVTCSANSHGNCHYDLSGHIQYLRHTVSIGNRFPWLYINCIQSP